MCYRKRMTYQLIQYEARDGIAQITLNRPEKLNAWTPQMAVEQADAIGRANDDRSVGAIVMTGAGRAFCAGADMELTFKSRIEGRDPGEDTAGGQGGMPAGLGLGPLVRGSKPPGASGHSAAVGIGLTTILPFRRGRAPGQGRVSALFINGG